jgi:hypothetical protein
MVAAADRAAAGAAPHGAGPATVTTGAGIASGTAGGMELSGGAASPAGVRWTWELRPRLVARERLTGRRRLSVQKLE